MAEYSSRSGRKVSDYRKRFYSNGNGMSNSEASLILSVVANNNRITAMKHIRGEITIGPANSLLNQTAPRARGLVGLVRYPQPETLNYSDLTTEASWFLHPVAWTLVTYPITVPYEFKAITIGERERLYLVVWSVYQTVSLITQTMLIWDEKLQITSDA